MYIRKIEIEEFGKLRDLTLDLGQGLNLVEGKNESGKSTLQAFFRFVLYGFPAKNSADGEERDKRLSWQGRRAAGSLTLWHEGRTYRITRDCFMRGTATRATPTESLTVADIENGEILSLGKMTPGEHFLGLPAELYDSSLFLSQSGAARVARPAVQEALGDLLFSGDSTLCAEEAPERLQDARRELQHIKGRGGKIAALEDQLAELDAALAKARADAAALGELRDTAQRFRVKLERANAQGRELADCLERVELDAKLQLFEDLRQAEGEELRRHTALNLALQAVGALPDRQTLAQMAMSAREAERAEQGIARLTPSLEQLRTVTHDETLVRAAELVQEQGGVKPLLEQVRGAERKKKSRRTSAVLFFILSLALLGAHYALPLLGVTLPPMPINPLLLAAPVMLLLSLLSAVGLLKAHKCLRRLLAPYGQHNSATLITYLTQCEREAQSYRDHVQRLNELEQELSNLNTQLSALLAELADKLEPFAKLDPPFTVTQAADVLIDLGERQTRAQEILSAAQVAFEAAKNAHELLAQRLKQENEQSLRERANALPPCNDRPELLRNKQRLLEHTLAEYTARLSEAEHAVTALMAVARDPLALEAEREGVLGRLNEHRDRLTAINMALEAMEEAADELRRGITPRLRSDASTIFADLTGGKYHSLLIGPDFSISLDASGTPLPLSRFSEGCRDAAHLSLRLALLATVSEQKLPLFLDEAFAHLDNDRAAALLAVIVNYCKAGGQALLFTCHTREGEMLLGTPGITRFRLGES